MRAPKSSRRLENPAPNWSLSDWVGYKKKKMDVFIERGYSIGWHPDKTGWLHVYIPNHNYTGTPKLSAYVNFGFQKSEDGVTGGRIWELNILEPKRGLHYRDPKWLYQFCIGRCAINRLENHFNGRTLYNSVIKLLN